MEMSEDINLSSYKSLSELSKVHLAVLTRNVFGAILLHIMLPSQEIYLLLLFVLHKCTLFDYDIF